MGKKRGKKDNVSWDTPKGEPDDKKLTSYLGLYRYAKKSDYLYIAIAVIFSIIRSICTPMTSIGYSEFTSMLVERNISVGSNKSSSSTITLKLFGGGKILTNATLEEVEREIVNDGRAFALLSVTVALVQLVAGIFCIDFFNKTALRQVTDMRIELFKSFMRQEIGWHDVIGSKSNYTVRVTDDIEKIREGIGEKVSHYIVLICGVFVSLAISVAFGWKLSLIVIGYVPILIIKNRVVGMFQSRLQKRESKLTVAATNVAEEVLGSIKTVFAFCGQHLELKRYTELLEAGKKINKKRGLILGFEDGIMRLLYFGIMAGTYWYGVSLVLYDSAYTPAVLMMTMIGLSISAENIPRASPYNEAFSNARGSATGIFNYIDRVSKIDSLANQGSKLLDVQGHISFRNVHFSYPSRPNIPILRGFNLDIPAGQSIAIVGNSGNGKSTCLQLLQRFYDPDEGEILIDGHDIRTINVQTLRTIMATVGQEPVLFSTTIGENIRYGKPDATDEEVIAAAKGSGAHDFLAKQPLKYNTYAGEKGSQFSGGQKQRVAIARALIQSPKILLLDESTSALDYESEKFVQSTLDRVSKGRTTLTVSHRFSAIRGAERIVFLDKGIAIEDGTHTQLMAQKGQYYEMISAGHIKEAKDRKDSSSRKRTKEIEKPELKDEDDMLVPVIDDGNYFPKEIPTDKDDEDDDQKRLITLREQSEADKLRYCWMLGRIFMLARPEWLGLFVSAICAFLIGSTGPIGSILMGEVYGSFAESDPTKTLKAVFIVCMVLIGLGGGTFILAFLQLYSLIWCGSKFTVRMRIRTFAAMLRQEAGWFDVAEHTPTALGARLVADAGILSGIIGVPLILILQSGSNIIIGFVIAFSNSWQLSLICLAAIPLSLCLVILEAAYTAKATIKEKKLIEVGTKIATEAIDNIRTVASLRQEKYMIERVENEMRKVERIVRKKYLYRGVSSALSSSFTPLFYAGALYYGGVLVSRHEIPFNDVIKVTESLLLSINVLSQSLIYIPVFAMALVGAHRIFEIMDRQPLIKSPTIENKSRIAGTSNDIEFKRIDFRYPTRPNVQILKGFSIRIDEGKTIAFVGPSGCGKSTCIQLLQRLYDPETGRIYVGLDEISTDITLDQLRSQLSIVSQEPVLFSRTIAENIAYGDNSRKVSMDEIIDAAKIANVHSFIAQLPLGYDTNIGSKTAQLSGGQRQRIAIARAVVKNPKILLLDEATSSLDLHSEQVVQQALDSARVGRTCLVIAHRLSTVQNADAICVMHAGHIIEYGTHHELLAIDGLYARLYNAQR